MLRGETAQTAAGFNRPINYNPRALPEPFNGADDIEWEPMNVMQRKFPPHPVSGIEVYRDEAEVQEAEFSALGMPRKTKCDYDLLN